MKNLKMTTAAIITAGILALITACNMNADTHEHTFKTEWSSDETNHWHAASCEHKDEVKDKAAHTFGDWTVTLEATEEAEGKKERECSVCHYKETDKVAKLAHTHKFATAYSSDATNHWYTATCDHKEQVKDKAEHTFGEWKVTVEATEEAEGKKERECSVCGYKTTETVAKLAHTHKFATAYSSDANYHWYAATCDHKEQVKDKTAHTFGEWKITTQPTEEAEGAKERVCSACGYKVTDTVAKLDHVHAKGTHHDAVASTCVKKGNVKYYDCVKANCEVKLDEDGKPLATIESELDSSNHTGTATTWTKTATKHKETYDCCKAVKTVEADHTFGEWKSNNDATTEADGTKTRICSVCSYEDTVTDAGTKIEIVKTPVFSVAAGEVESGTSVTLTCATEGAKIYYTTDGSEPTASSTEYTAAISVTPPLTIKAIAIKNGLNNSAVASVSYTVMGTVATPVFSIGSRMVNSGTGVTISCTTDGAKIYYTTNGSVPTAASTEYTAAITVTEAVTIKAIAVKDRMHNSAVASVSYTMPPEGFAIVAGGTVTGAAYTDNYEGVFPAGRNVTLGSFYMGKYEVTQAQYKSVMEGQKVTVDGTEYTLADSPSYCVQGSTDYKIDADKDHANYPVENVTWFDAVYYCNALSAKEGLQPCYTITVTQASADHINDATVEYDKTKNGYRLPTEAEWEYAARGGDPTAADWNYTYSGANKADGTSYDAKKNAGLDSVGWYCYNNISGTTGDTDVTNSADGCGTHEVGQKAANRLGIYDMSGNVYEWCYDWYGSTSSETVTDPAGASSGDYRVFRGGSWYNSANIASVSDRSRGSPNNPSFNLGFRVCRNAN